MTGKDFTAVLDTFGDRFKEQIQCFKKETQAAFKKMAEELEVLRSTSDLEELEEMSLAADLEELDSSMQDEDPGFDDDLLGGAQDDKER